MGAPLSLVIDFDDSVNSLLTIDRSTGEQQRVELDGHRLSVTLMGGSGRLYKYDEGAFPPDYAPLDEGGEPDAGLPGGDGGIGADAQSAVDAAAVSPMDAGDASAAGDASGGCDNGGGSEDRGGALLLVGLVLMLARRRGSLGVRAGSHVRSNRRDQRLC